MNIPGFPKLRGGRMLVNRRRAEILRPGMREYQLRRNRKISAVKMETPFEIDVGDGCLMQGEVGDYLVDNGRALIAYKAAVFESMYEPMEVSG